jgi:PAS domain S-box-containing protein
LIAEHDPLVARSIENALRRAGYAIVGAVRGGREAVARAGRDKPDLVLIDTRLHGEMDGIEVMERIHAEHNLPVILLSSDADSDALARAQAAGSYGYLIKPYDPQALHGAIEMALHRHEMEKRLQETGARLRALLDAPADAWAMLDREGTVIESNVVTATSLNCTRAELLGTCIYDYFFPDIAATRRASVQGVFASGEPTTFEDSRAGKVFENHLYPVRDETGAVYAVAVYARDVTAQHLAAAAWRRDRARHRLFAETARDVMWTMDNDYRLTYVSPSIRHLRGLEAEEAMREAVEESMTPASYRALRAAHARREEAEARGEMDTVDYVEIQQEHADGSLVWVEMLIQPILDDDGRRIGFLGVSRDISARKADGSST